MMEKVVTARLYSTAIVLGSSAGQNLDSTVRDSRVLQIMLILRSLTEGLPGKPGKTMHIVGENSLDQTSKLALGPRTTATSESDFVNVQAIIARSLVMNVAYPQMWDAVSELLGLGGPDINFMAPVDLGILELEVSCGAVQHLVGEAYHGFGVAIGIMVGTELRMRMRPGDKIRLSALDRIAVISRGRPTKGPTKVPQKTKVGMDLAQAPRGLPSDVEDM